MNGADRFFFGMWFAAIVGLLGALLICMNTKKASGQEPATYEGWSGCRERVVVLDKGVARIFERCEEFLTTDNATPGTGLWGEWRECYPHKVGAKSWTFDFRIWPKAVKQKEVARLFGKKAWKWFVEHPKARVSWRYNLTGNKAWGDWF